MVITVTYFSHCILVSYIYLEDYSGLMFLYVTEVN